jgi:dTDP-4-amino-4,6-dideoxygalactose transaminase
MSNSINPSKSAAMGQQPISWWRTQFGDDEICRITESIRNENISQGPVVREFEERVGNYFGTPYVVATTSGSVALLMALMTQGIGPGDEVIVPNRTWISVAHAVALLGAKVRLVDVEAERPIMDVKQVASAINPKTKAIVPTHLNGRSANMGEIRRLAKSHNICVIEDAAQALGSRNADGLLGIQSDMGCFSLSIAKIIATGQVGFVGTREKALYDKLVSLRTHGVSNVIDVNWSALGFNFRFTDILASIGLVQFEQLADRIKKVKALYVHYQDALRGLSCVEMIPVELDSGEVPVYIEVLCRQRERLVVFLAEKGIQTRPFYPDLHHATYLGSEGEFPNSKKFSSHGLFLPCGPSQSSESIDRVIEELKNFSNC